MEFDTEAVAQKIVRQILERTDAKADICLVLGSGWGGVSRFLENCVKIPYSALEEMPVCGVAGHAGNFLLGSIGGKRILIVQGRFHMYEGRSAAEIVLPIRIAYELGAKAVFLTNAAGGLNMAFSPGDLMVLKDHINLTCRNPLIGVAPREDRPVFVDMSEVYDGDFRKQIIEKCKELEIPVHEGVYLQVLGPSFETPAEIRAFQKLGADAVGMSTVLEAIYARYLAMKVAGISCITNMGAGLFSGKIRHEDVLQESNRREELFSKLLYSVLSE